MQDLDFWETLVRHGYYLSICFMVLFVFEEIWVLVNPR